MNKWTLRSFAYGILLSVCLIGAFYYFQDDTKLTEMQIDDAKSVLEEAGYIILSKTEYNDFKESSVHKTEENTSEEQK